MTPGISRISLTTLILLACWACSAPPQKGAQIKNYDRLDDAYGYVVELAQGWTDDTQQAFYNTPQGSEIMPYEWLVALEQKDSKTPFLAEPNITRFRYLPRKKSPANPDGLPVGWTKAKGSLDKEWFGLTCAACHTGQLEYMEPGTQQNVQIRIDGAPTLADFNLMNYDLVAALQATLDDPDKFDRFARAVLKAGDNPDARTALRIQVTRQTAVLNTRNEINKAEVHYGFARIDAIGFIFNQTMSTLPDMPQNAKPSDAPASYPFIWGTDQSDVVQWTGFAANLDGAGTLVRNGGEVIGVYGKVELTSGDSYPSSLLIDNLGKLENWVRELNSPVWPDGIFPAIDMAKAGKGEKLYQELCASCHQVIPRGEAIKTGYKAVITSLETVGTDPTELCNMQTREYDAGIYTGKKYVAGIAGEKIPNPTTGLNPLINAVSGALRDHLGESLKAFYDEHATRSGSSSGSVQGYKARPLNGIWATAPYLHNGSVPNLYELLKPASERSETFVLGSRMYDPKHVGYAMDQPRTAEAYTPFVFDTRIKGNWNRGHEYGTCVQTKAENCQGDKIVIEPGDCKPLTDEQRWQLVEYMKTL